MTTLSAQAAGRTAFSPRRLLSLPPSYLVLVALLVIAGFASSTLLNPVFVSIILRQCAPLGVFVLGQALVMRAGSIDLSSSGVLAMTIYLVSAGVLPESQPWMFIAVPIAVGLGVGILNGLLVAKVRASAVIVTLALGTVLTGLVLMFSAGQPPGSVPDWLRVVNEDAVGPVSYSVIIWFLLSALVAIGLRTLVFGRFLAAVGNNPRAASTAGLPLPRVIITSHILAGLLAASAALLQTGAMGVGSIKPGLDVVLNSIAAAILGGITFGRGRGGVIGPLAAVIAFGYLFAILTVFGVQEPGKLIVQGIVIAAAAISYGVRNK
ncbi:ABC transporter permease [Paraburkholderia fungorum]|uniref:ABC transporter permease n=1 Tax=Paraburkholderia fungorum TaxID=134537 RepID=UPI001C1EB4DE|nr:ABC transporter permease [Paraburkholderia fungorum]MBU7435814.1 ABC transporter permease [Paraburkholderia fungorum]